MSDINKDKAELISTSMEDLLRELEKEDLIAPCGSAGMSELQCPTTVLEDFDIGEVQEMDPDGFIELLAENDIEGLEVIELDLKRKGQKSPDSPDIPLNEKTMSISSSQGISLLVSKDALRCYVEIDTAAQTRMLTVSILRELLAEAGVTYGIMPDHNLKNKLELAQKEDVGPFLVAMGTPPRKGINASVKFHCQPGGSSVIDNKHENDDPSGSVDYRESSRNITSVSAGEVLAEITGATRGETGTDVYGRPIPGKHGKGVPIRPGKNVARDETGRKYYATASGQPILSSDTISVIPELIIDGDVDFGVGNINFTGSVQIKGTIRDGFRVKAGGDITVKGNIEAAYIECDGNLHARHGITGRNIATVKCSGSIEALYIENADVTVEGNLFVSRGILHSEILCNGNVVVTSRTGRIIGGRVIARNLVETHYAGSEAEVKTEICVGRDANIQKTLWVLEEKKQAISMNLKKLEFIIEKASKASNEGIQISPEIRESLLRVAEKQAELKASLKTISADYTKLTREMFSGIPGRVKVHKLMYANTHLEIGSHMVIVTEPRKHVMLMEDKANLTIQMINLF